VPRHLETRAPYARSMTDATPHDDLLDGARGRRLCFSLLTSAFPELWRMAFYAKSSEDEVLELARAVADASAALDDASLLDALEDAISTAKYWQPADETDFMLLRDELRAALEPTARRVERSEAAAWWWSPIALDDQHYVQWVDEYEMQPPALTDAASRLGAWRANAQREEERWADRPADVTANHSGSWWSTPALVEMVTTTRARSDLAAVKLRLVEDALGWTEARVVPLRPRSAPRVFEITGRSAWARLVARYPLDVTLSRRHDWWRVTGMDERWAIPDWQAVAADFDAVHLTVAGYLTTAGTAIPVGEAFTLLAGWNPDETYWLSDILEPTGPMTNWRRDDVAWGCDA
jgi:hypothetical protein